MSGKLVVLAEGRRGEALVGKVGYHLRRPTPDGPQESLLYSLRFAPGQPLPDGMVTGDAVSLEVDLDLSGPVPYAADMGATSGGPAGSLWVAGWAPLYDPSASGGLGPPPAYYDGVSPLALRAVVWVAAEACGAAGGMTVEDVSAVFFGPAPRPRAPVAARFPPMSLERLWDLCSYGAVQLKRPQVLVLSVTLPCAGVRANGAAWNASGGACGADEMWGWMEAAAQQTQQVLGIDPAPYLRRLLLLPAAPSLCRAWAHRSTLGCDSARGCDMWVKADRLQLLERAAAALGASMALRPATAQKGAGGGAWLPADPSDPTGTPDGGYRCFNGPAAWRLRFASALQLLSSANVYPQGLTFSAQLPAAATTPANLLVVAPEWMAPPVAGRPSPAAASLPALFLQYRPPLAGDAGLAGGPVAGLVTLHALGRSAGAQGDELQPLVPGELLVPADAAPSQLLAALGPGTTFRFEAGKLLIRYTALVPPPDSDDGGVSGGWASVSLCRYAVGAESEAEEGCANGVDDDCDGLTDAEDPDCQGL